MDSMCLVLKHRINKATKCSHTPKPPLTSRSSIKLCLSVGREQRHHRTIEPELIQILTLPLTSLWPVSHILHLKKWEWYLYPPHFTGLLWRWNDLMHMKCLAQCLWHSQCSIYDSTSEFSKKELRYSLKKTFKFSLLFKNMWSWYFILEFQEKIKL